MPRAANDQPNNQPKDEQVTKPEAIQAAKDLADRTRGRYCVWELTDGTYAVRSIGFSPCNAKAHTVTIAPKSLEMASV